MILENEPSVVIGRQIDWATHDSGERVPMVHGQELYLRKNCSYSKVLFCFRRSHLSQLMALSRFELDSKEKGTGIVCIDVGANIGYIATYLAMRSDVLKVLAFEPDPESFNVLKRNSIKYPKILPIEIGIGSDTNSLRSLWLGESNSAHNMSTVVDQKVPSPGEGIDRLSPAPINVPFTSIDSLSMGLNVGLIKVDVQGGEAEALRGAWLTIERNSPLIWLEFTPEQVDSSRQELIQTLNEILGLLEYQLYISDEFGYLSRLSKEDLSSYAGDIFLAPSWLKFRDN